MAKKFTNKSKLLQEHHTELIRADTTAQSNEITEDDFSNIINEAKKLLRDDEMDRDIFDIQNSIEQYSQELEKYKQDEEHESEVPEIYEDNSEKNRELDIVELQNSVDEYSKELELYKQDVTASLCKSRETIKNCKTPRTRLCKTREMIKWNDDIYDAPNPKNNKEYLHQIPNSTNDTHLDESDAEEKEIEALTSMILDKYEFLEKTKIPQYEVSRTEIKSGSTSKGKLSIITGPEKDKFEYTINYELENTVKHEYKNNKNNVECRKKWEQNYSEITDIPELKITPHKVKKVYLEVKKLSIENTETTQNFDSSPREFTETRNKQIQTHETRIKQAKNRIASNTIIQWKYYVKKKQDLRKAEIEAKKADKQLQKINNFVEKLETFKKEIHKRAEEESIKESLNPTSTTNLKHSKRANYEYRYKAQKEIIEMQKQKLAEQKRIIEELKQNKIQQEVRNSFENARILQKSILKKPSRIPKLDIREDTESQPSESNPLNLVLKLSSVPQNIKTMEDRAKERHEKRMIIQERKRLLDQEKKRLVEEAMQRKAKEEQEEKQVRMQKIKRQRDLVRQMELKKQLEKQRYIQLTETAHKHYKTKLKKLGMDRLKFLVYNLKINCEIAKRFYENNITLKCFKSWQMYSSEIINNKNKLATDLFSKNLLSKAWSRWKSYQFQIVQMNQVAVDRYEMSLQIKCFKEWRKLICKYRAQFIANSKKADKYYKRALLFHCLEKWRSLPAIMQIEKVQNERKRKWRLRVAEILSDYDPHKNYEV